MKNWLVAIGWMVIMWAVSVNANAQHAVTDSSRTVCRSAAIISAQDVGKGVGLWTAETAGVVISSPKNATTTVSKLKAGANVFVWTVTENGVTASDKITIYRAEPFAFAGKDETVCASVYNLQATISVKGVGEWQSLSGNGEIQDFRKANTKVLMRNPGLYRFQWKVTTKCGTATDIVEILSAGVTANAGEDKFICRSKYRLSAELPVSDTETTGYWSVVEGTAKFADSTSPYTLASGLGYGKNTIRWTVSNPYCGISSDNVVLSRNEPAYAGADQTSCDAMVQLNAKAPLQGKGKWITVRGTASFNNPYSPNATVKVDGGNTLLRWLVESDCRASRDELWVLYNKPDKAFAGTDKILCRNDSRLQANMPKRGKGQWTDLTTNGNASFDRPNEYRTEIIGLAYGKNYLAWTITNNCGTSTDELLIINGLQPSANAGANQTVCSKNIVLEANVPLNGKGFWTIISGNVSLSDAKQANAILSIEPGIAELQWTIDGYCDYTNDLVTLSYPRPLAAFAGANQTTCDTRGLLTARDPKMGRGIWTDETPFGEAVFGKKNIASTFVQQLAKGQNTLRWTVSAPCGSVSDEVKLMSLSLPEAYAGNDTIVFSEASVLNAQAIHGHGKWSVVKGDANFADRINANTAITELDRGENIYRWTVENQCGRSVDNVSVTMNRLSVFAGNDFKTCGSETYLKVQVSEGLGRNGVWTCTKGSVVFENPNDTETFAKVGKGTNVARYTVKSTMGVFFDEVQIGSEILPKTYAGADTVVCDPEFRLNASGNTDGKWVVLDGNIEVYTPTNPRSMATFTSTEPPYAQLQWIAINGCGSASDFVIITSNAETMKAGPDVEICGSAANLNAYPPMSGEASWQVVLGSANFVDTSDPYTQVTVGEGENVIKWTKTGRCGEVFDALTIFSKPIPNAFAGNDTVVCADNAFLHAGSHASGRWSVVKGSGVFFNGNEPTTKLTHIGQGKNVYAWTVDTECGLSDDYVMVTNGIIKADAGTDMVLCENRYVAGANLPAGATGKWTALTKSLAFDDTSDPYSFITLTETENLMVWGVTNGVCADSDTLKLFYGGFTVSAGDDKKICKGGAVVLQASAGTSFYWSPQYGLSDYNEQKITANPKNSVSYMLTAINKYDCDAYDTINVWVSNGPVLFAEIEDVTTKEGANGVISLNITEGNAPYTYNWSNGTTDSLAKSILAGKYTVKVTDAAGCAVEETFEVKEVLCRADYSFLMHPDKVLDVSFNSSSFGSISKYKWYFGDGSSSTEKTPKHSFQKAGDYSVCLFIADESISCESVICKEVSISGTIDVE